jgi:large subunit ribosomal protein L4
MPSAQRFDTQGESRGTVELDEAIFGVEPNVAVMHQVVTAHRANARADTYATKNRSEVRGGGAKPWRQKGTGRARHGSVRAPQWTGGAAVHTPRPEEHHAKQVPKKMRRAALRSALSDRAASDDAHVVAELAFDEPRTKNGAALLAALGLSDRRVLVVLARNDPTTRKSFRNLPGVELITVEQLNTYQVLCNDAVVLAEEALGYIGTGTRPDLGPDAEAPAEESVPPGADAEEEPSDA